MFIREVNDALIKELSGESTKYLIEAMSAAEDAKDDAAEKTLTNSLNDKAKAYFETDAVTFRTRTDRNKIHITINLAVLDIATVDAISTILKHSGLIPRAQCTKYYEL